MAFKYKDLMSSVAPGARAAGAERVEPGPWLACPANSQAPLAPDRKEPGPECDNTEPVPQPECPDISQHEDDGVWCPDNSQTGAEQARGAVAPARLAAELALLQEQLRQCLAQSP